MAMKNQSFVIYMNMIEGHPNGLKIIEKSNWSGVGLYIPRTRLNNSKNRVELKKPGVYMLLGDVDLAPKIYIGEGDPLLDRLLSHESKKEFWDVLIAFTSKDTSLNKAIIQHLESRLINTVERSKGFESQNRNKPKPPSLSDNDLSVAEGYLNELLLCLPVLGVTFDTVLANEVTDENKFILKNSKGIQGNGILTDNGFTVLKGSHASYKESEFISPCIKTKRSDLLSKGVLKDSGKGYYEFTCDFSFGSPSSAAGVIQGRAANGRAEWKNSVGASINELEDRALKSTISFESDNLRD